MIFDAFNVCPGLGKSDPPRRAAPIHALIAPWEALDVDIGRVFRGHGLLLNCVYPLGADDAGTRG